MSVRVGPVVGPRRSWCTGPDSRSSGYCPYGPARASQSYGETVRNPTLGCPSFPMRGRTYPAATRVEEEVLHDDPSQAFRARPTPGGAASVAGPGPHAMRPYVRPARCRVPVGTATAHRYIAEAVDLLAALAPTLAEAVKAASTKSFVLADGALLPIDRIAADRPLYSG